MQKPPPLPSTPHEEKINVLMAARTGERAGERFLKDWLHFPRIYLYMHKTRWQLSCARLFAHNVFLLCYNGNGVASNGKEAAEGLDA